jgi:hypothetical protein
MMEVSIPLFVGVGGWMLQYGYARFVDRKSIAFGILGELRSYASTSIINGRNMIADAFSAEAAEVLRNGCMSKTCFLPGGKMIEGHPVYDKVADRLGVFNADAVITINRVYNGITAIRRWIELCSTNDFHNADTASQVNRLQTYASVSLAVQKDGEAVCKYLEAVSNQKIGAYFLTTVYEHLGIKESLWLLLMSVGLGSIIYFW